jgi:hypothetical protein
MEKLLKCYIWSLVVYCAEIGKLRKLDQKYLEIFKKRCWSKMKKIIWTDGVKMKKCDTE